MDINDLMSKMLSGDTVKGLAKAAGTSQKDVKGVLSAAMPALLEGALGQANGKDTAEGFVTALSAHAKDDTTDLASFFSGVDLADGGKIVSHLLGSGADKATSAAAKEAGVEKAKAGNILSAAAPLLMSLLGQQASSGSNASSNNASGIAGLMTSLLGNTDVTSLIGGLISGVASGNDSTGKKKKKKKTDSGKTEGGLLNTILGFFRG